MSEASVSHGGSSFARRLLRVALVAIGMLAAFFAVPLALVAASPSAARAIGGVVVLVTLLALLRPIPMVGLGSRGMSTYLLLVSLITFVLAGDHVDKQRSELLASLRQTDTKAYLEKVREFNGRTAWLKELKELDPEAHEAEIARLERERRERERAEYKKKCEDEVMAYTMAEEFVKRSLKAPSTADFPWFRSDMVRYTGDCTHMVRSHVDAQNSFGAVLRSSWRAEVKYDGGAWRLLDIEIN